MLLDQIEPETGNFALSSNDFYLISKSSEKGAAPSFIHAQLLICVAISHNLLITLIHFETIMLQIMWIKDYTDVENKTQNLFCSIFV